jgi:hypothetical protein
MQHQRRGGRLCFQDRVPRRLPPLFPGVQLELEAIHRLHRDRDIQWMDSCAEPNHAMIDHLWVERRTIQTVTVPAPGRFAASIRSLMDLRNHYARALGKLRAKRSYAS